MANKSASVVRAELVDTATLCTVDELCLACNVDANWIAELVEHGVIEPIREVGADWRFTSLTIVRIAKAKRLERDLNLNPPGLAVVLDLLDEIDDLRAQLGKIPKPAKSAGSCLQEGRSRSSFSATRKRAASPPFTTRWSKVSERGRTARTAGWPS